MTEPLTGMLLVVSGDRATRGRPQCEQLARALQARLQQPVVFCSADEPAESMVAGLRTLVASGAQRLVIAPLDLPPRENPGETLPAIKWASRRWPFLSFHAAAPLDWQNWADWIKEIAMGALVDRSQPSEVAVLVVGAGCSDAATNANVARLAHLVWEASEFASVEYAFLDAARLGIQQAVNIQARVGVRHIAVIPWLLFDDDRVERLTGQVKRAARQHHVHMTVAAVPLVHEVLMEFLISRYEVALTDHSFLAPTWSEVQKEILRSLGPSSHPDGGTISAEEEAQLRELDRKINEMLPPYYQGRYEETNPQPMGSTPLKFGTDGKVAWDEMWAGFCDLALAGGPPHRGTLLEAVAAADALAGRERYQEVVAEIERGIRVVTGLPVVPSTIPGWVGVRCDSEEMAIWLMRAIIVENVMVRREGDVIFLPAGPKFTLQREIKNVVTVIAKTAHYWTAHIVAKRQGITQSSVASTGRHSRVTAPVSFARFGKTGEVE